MIIFVILLVFLILLLGYLSFSDIKSHEIPFLPSLLGLIFVIMIVLVSTVSSETSQLPDLKDSLFGLVVAGGLTSLIVLLSREKALGSGDIIIFGIMGVSLGLSNLLIGFLISLYSATFYGIFLAIRKKKFHGLEVPLVPFISFGIITALLFSTEIKQLFESLIFRGL